MKTTSILSVLSLMLWMANLAVAGTNLNADEILKKTQEAYANCKSYMDTGYVRTVFMDKNGKETNIRKLIFSTSYVRPDKFRFEYGERIADETQGVYIIWKNGEKLKTYWSLKGEQIPESLSMAIAGATGVSGGSAHTIPRLLIAEVKGKLVTLVQNPVLLNESRDDNGVMCYLIKLDKNRTIWIQKETFLISRIQEFSEFDTFNTKSVTAYNPEVNVNIPDKYFIFRK